MDVVTFETAERLKDSGFPQPDLNEVGTFWFAKIRGYNVLCFRALKKMIIIFGGNGQLKDFVFAPTATDILRLLPDYYLFTNGLLFQVWRHNVALPQRSVNDSPAEAAAEVWLSQNEKKQ